MTTLTLPTFNPITFAKRLKEVGVPDKQAELEAEVLHETLTQQTQAVSALENQVKTLAAEAKRDAGDRATKGDVALLEAKIALARRDTIIWLGGMLIAGFGTVITLLFKLLG